MDCQPCTRYHNDMNIADELSRQAVTRPNAVAVLMPNGSLTYRQLDDLTWRATGFLHRQGVSRGDVAAMSFADELAQLIAFFAVARLGCSEFSIAPMMPALLKNEMLETVDADILIGDGDLSGVNLQRSVNMTVELLLAGTSDIDRSLSDPKPEAYCVIAAGSGSTGRQKLIPYTHQQFLEIAARTARQYTLLADDHLATLVPMHYISTKRRYLSVISTGATLVLFNRSRVDPVALANEFKLSILVGTVFHLEHLLNNIHKDASNLMPGLRILVVTSSTVSSALRNRIAVKLTRNLGINYGANESTTMTWARAPEVFEVEGTVGAPMEGVSVEIIDGDDNPLPPGEVGQIRLKAPGMVDGYWKDAAASRDSFRNGWFYPGDLGKFTTTGQLIYCGRADHMMIMNGINIYPAEIERVVSNHPAVRDTAVIPLRHPVHQDFPVCAIALRAGASLSYEEILEYARQRLGASTPQLIYTLEEIPRDERGKLRRKELAQQLAHKMKAAPPSPRG